MTTVLPLRIDEILAATGGRFAASPTPGIVPAISTDNRAVAPGSLFAPFIGVKHDAHDFVTSAFEQGAAWSLSAASRVESLRERGVDLGRIIVVDDTLRAYQAIAAHYRRKFRIPVAGVTGSNGKTTTKDLLAALLSTAFAPVVKTPENLNNEYGVPQTVLRIDETTGAAVIEMAMRLPEEIRPLARIAQPDVGLITNIGEAHLERLGSVEAIADAKGELIEELAPEATAVLPRDSAFYERLASKARCRVVSFGTHAHADVRVVDTRVSGLDRMLVTLAVSGETIQLPVLQIGLHNASNMACAVASARALGVPLDVLARYEDHFHPSHGRMEVRETSAGFTVLDDAYNASPASTRSALETMGRLPISGRRAAVLGDMLELGPSAAEMHFEVGRLAGAAVDMLVTVGELGQRIAEGARERGMATVHHAGDVDEATALVRDWARPGDLVLVKASRGMRLDRVVEALS